MPEGPEVARTVRFLNGKLDGLEIEKASVSWPKTIANMSVEEFDEKMEHQTIETISRYGKYLIFHLSHGIWICHLRMEGRFSIVDQLPEEPKERKHIHAVFKLSNPQLLCYRDTRKFGRMWFYDPVDNVHDLEALRDLGPDAFSDEFSGTYLHEKLAKRKTAIKTLLLNQQIVAGIGNIYADEILFQAGVHPLRPGQSLSMEECEKIANAAHEILKAALDKGGTTIRSFEGSDGHPGSFQNQLKVHRKENKPCPNCEQPIEKILVNNRSTYLCPKCQK